MRQVQRTCLKPTASPPGLPGSLLVHHRTRYPQEDGKEDAGREEAGDGINEVMCLDIDGGTAQQEIERSEDGKQPVVAVVPEEQHADGADAHVRTREGGRRAFAGGLGIFDEMIEDAVGESRTGQARLVVVEVTVQTGEDTCRDVLQSYRLVIEGRSGDRHEDEDNAAKNL